MYTCRMRRTMVGAFTATYAVTTALAPARARSLSRRRSTNGGSSAAHAPHVRLDEVIGVRAHAPRYDRAVVIVRVTRDADRGDVRLRVQVAVAVDVGRAVDAARVADELDADLEAGADILDNTRLRAARKTTTVR